MLNSVYIEKDNEDKAPPERVLKVSFFSGGKSVTGAWMDPVIFLAIGDFNEGTYDDSFKSSADRQFSITLEDLLRSLQALGAIHDAQVKVPLDAA